MSNIIEDPPGGKISSNTGNILFKFKDRIFLFDNRIFLNISDLFSSLELNPFYNDYEYTINRSENYTLNIRPSAITNNL